MSATPDMCLIGVRNGRATATLLLRYAARGEIREFRQEMAATGRTVDQVSIDEMRDRMAAPLPGRGGYVLAEDVIEALDAIDRHAERDLDHELHALVEHYRGALGVRP